MRTLSSRSCRRKAKKKDTSLLEGVLEILPDGYGFLPLSRLQLPARPRTTFTFRRRKSASLRPFKTGDTISGQVRPPHEGEKVFRAGQDRGRSISESPDEARNKILFDNLTPLYPAGTSQARDHTRKYQRPRHGSLLTPLGKEDSAVSSFLPTPRAGKTMLLQNVANSITANHPEVVLMVLLIDERPEEVTDMQRSVSKREWVISSHLRRARRPPRTGCGNGDRKSQETSRTQARRSHPALRFDYSSRPRLQHHRPALGQSALRRRRLRSALQRPKRFFEISSATSKKAAHSPSSRRPSSTPVPAWTT